MSRVRRANYQPRLRLGYDHALRAHNFIIFKKKGSLVDPYITKFLAILGTYIFTYCFLLKNML